MTDTAHDNELNAAQALLCRVLAIYDAKYVAALLNDIHGHEWTRETLRRLASGKPHNSMLSKDEKMPFWHCSPRVRNRAL